MNRLLALVFVLIQVSLPSLAGAQDAVPARAEHALGNSVEKSVAIPADSSVKAVPTAAHEGGLPQFNTHTWPSQIFWLVVSFGFLYFFFSRFTLPSLTGTIQARADKIETDIKTAEQLSAQAENVRLGYEADLKKAAAQSSSDMKKIDEEAKARLAVSLADFRTRYEKEMTVVEANLEASKNAAMLDMQKIAADIAAQAAEKIAGISADTSQAQTIVNSLKDKAA